MTRNPEGGSDGGEGGDGSFAVAAEPNRAGALGVVAPDGGAGGGGRANAGGGVSVLGNTRPGVGRTLFSHGKTAATFFLSGCGLCEVTAV